MTTPTPNSPPLADSGQERAKCATSGAIPAEEFAAMKRFSMSHDKHGYLLLWKHAPALLAAYEERETLRSGYADAVMAANSAAAKHAAKDNAIANLKDTIDMMAADVVREREARMQREQRIVTGGGNPAFTSWQVIAAVNGACSCGGKGPNDGCCQACEVYHRLTRRMS